MSLQYPAKMWTYVSVMLASVHPQRKHVFIVHNRQSKCVLTVCGRHVS